MSDTLVRARELLAHALETDMTAIGADAAIGVVETWDSLAHMRLVNAIEENLGRELSPDAIVSIASVKDVAAILERGADAA